MLIYARHVASINSLMASWMRRLTHYAILLVQHHIHSNILSYDEEVVKVLTWLPRGHKYRIGSTTREGETLFSKEWLELAATMII